MVVFDIEGINLSRIGDMTCRSVGKLVPNGVHVFLCDVISTNPIRDEILLVLKQLFEDNNVVKIIHDCRQDSDALHKQANIMLNNVFDTSTYAMMLTSPDGSGNGNMRKNLNTVLSQFNCNANSNRDQIKDLYKVNPNFWNQRPFTAFMIEYASKDVASLFDLRIKLLEIFNSLEVTEQNAILHANDATIIEFRSKKYHTVVNVAASAMGKVIGKNGSIIASIVKKAGVINCSMINNGFLFLADTNGQLDTARILVEQTATASNHFTKKSK